MKPTTKLIISLSTLLSTILIDAVRAENSSTFTLRESMRYAVENNNSIKIQQSENQSTNQSKIESVASLFPSLSASSGLTNSYGRSIDPETNTYTTSGNISNYYSISASLTVFDGLSTINSVKASQIRVEMGKEQLKKQSDETALTVMNHFFDVLYLKESVVITIEQLATSSETLRLTQKQMELGMKSPADVALAEAEVANYQLLLTQQQSSLDLAILNLKEQMNYPLDNSIELENSEISQSQNIDIFEALESNVEILAARNAVEESIINLKISRGRYLPTISIGAGYSTNYYKMLDLESAQRIFSNQIRDNYGYYVAAYISIPIFQGLSKRSNVIRSKNSLKIAQLQLSTTQLRVEKAIRESLLQRDNALKECESTKNKIEANSLANRAMIKKYEQGVASIIDLQKSSNDLLVAKAEELRAKFNYQIQCIMIDYYNGDNIY